MYACTYVRVNMYPFMITYIGVYNIKVQMYLCAYDKT